MKKQILTFIALCGSAFALEPQLATKTSQSQVKEVKKVPNKRVFLNIASPIGEAVVMGAFDPIFSTVALIPDIGVSLQMANHSGPTYTRIDGDLMTFYSLGGDIYATGTVNELLYFNPQANTSLYVGVGAGISTFMYPVGKVLCGIEFNRSNSSSKKIEASINAPLDRQSGFFIARVGFGFGF